MVPNAIPARIAIVARNRIKEGIFPLFACAAIDNRVVGFMPYFVT